jgi:hypothetical protein
MFGIGVKDFRISKREFKKASCTFLHLAQELASALVPILLSSFQT